MSQKKHLLVNSEPLGVARENYKLYLFRANQASDFLLQTLQKLSTDSFNQDGYLLKEKQEIDPFDKIYSHLVLWDENTDTLIGSYRFTKTSPVTQQYGVSGLYTSTLFHFEDHFKNKLPYGFELGKNFVIPEYRKTLALAYLMSGILKFILTEGDIQYVYGLLSIGGYYPPVVKAYIVFFYRLYFGDALNQQVKSHNEYLIEEQYMQQMQSVFCGNSFCDDFIKLNEVLSQHQYEIPSPLKHFTNVCEPEGTKMLAVGVDPDFGHCVDLFVMAEFDKIKPVNRKGYKKLIQDC